MNHREIGSFEPHEEEPSVEPLEETAGGRWQVRCADERLNPDPREAKVVGEFATLLEARKAAGRISRLNDVAYRPWDSESDEFAPPVGEE